MKPSASITSIPSARPTSRLSPLTLSLILLAGALAPAPARAAEEGILPLDEIKLPEQRRLIRIPEVNGMQVLKCDFHLHTVFTDGHVWPNVRVQEAWREGLDSFSFTEHLEYTPHKKDVTQDVSRSYELAKDKAAQSNLLLIKGAEITRETPPGHFNALFIGDTSGYVTDRNPALDAEAIDKAAAQNAFIFWNHPGWQAAKIQGSYEWLPFVEKLYQEKKLHGIEVANGFGIHTKAIDWALDRNLTILGNSDIHNLVAHEYDNSKPDGHRTMTLVFAKERTAAGVREALEARRTVAWAGRYLIGAEENVRALFHACVSVSGPYHQEGEKSKKPGKYYEITNSSDLSFELELKEGQGTRKISLPPATAQTLFANEGQKTLTYEVSSTFIRTDKHLSVTFELP